MTLGIFDPIINQYEHYTHLTGKVSRVCMRNTVRNSVMAIKMANIALCGQFFYAVYYRALLSASLYNLPVPAVSSLPSVFPKKKKQVNTLNLNSYRRKGIAFVLFH